MSFSIYTEWFHTTARMAQITEDKELVTIMKDHMNVKLLNAVTTTLAIFELMDPNTTKFDNFLIITNATWESLVRSKQVQEVTHLKGSTLPHMHRDRVYEDLQVMVR
jgi:hypothetical protein